MSYSPEIPVIYDKFILTLFNISEYYAFKLRIIFIFLGIYFLLTFLKKST